MSIFPVNSSNHELSRAMTQNQEYAREDAKLVLSLSKAGHRVQYKNTGCKYIVKMNGDVTVSQGESEFNIVAKAAINIEEEYEAGVIALKRQNQALVEAANYQHQLKIKEICERHEQQLIQVKSEEAAKILALELKAKNEVESLRTEHERSEEAAIKAYQVEQATIEKELEAERERYEEFSEEMDREFTTECERLQKEFENKQRESNSLVNQATHTAEQATMERKRELENISYKMRSYR